MSLNEYLNIYDDYDLEELQFRLDKRQKELSKYQSFVSDVERELTAIKQLIDKKTSLICVCENCLCEDTTRCGRACNCLWCSKDKTLHQPRKTVQGKCQT